MPGTVRTPLQLDTLFADNITGNISAQDGRDLISSEFGWASVIDPTVLNDNADSAGIGAYFSKLSSWMNTATQTYWRCFDGATGAAVWVKIGPSGGGGITVPLLLTSVADSSPVLELRQFSATQNGNLLECQTNAGVPGGARITGLADLTNPGRPGVTGQFNEIFGLKCCPTISTGHRNVIAGSYAGYRVTYAHGNVGAGYNAFFHLNTGAYNVAHGQEAGGMSTGGKNTCSGAFSLSNCRSGVLNTAVGFESFRLVDANGNTGLGAYSGGNVTTGTQLTLVGNRAGYTVTTGSAITIVGDNSQALAATDTDEVVMGAGITGNGTHTITIGSSVDTLFVASTSIPPSIAIGLVFASPASGSPGPAAFRALAVAELPTGYPFSDLTGSATATQLPTLDTIAAATGKLSASNLTAGYVCDLAIAVGILPVAQVSTGYPWADLTGVPVFPTLSEEASITATGATQGTAYALSATNNEVIAANPGVDDGVILWDAVGAVIWIQNSNLLGGFPVEVYPPSGASIGLGGVANAPKSLPFNSGLTFFRVSATQWYAK